MTTNATPPTGRIDECRARELALSQARRLTIPAFADRFPEQFEQTVDVLTRVHIANGMPCNA